ncbi:MAG: chromosome partitioning protein [Phenylobacterium sp.]|jgi:chromosome partitioning protein
MSVSTKALTTLKEIRLLKEISQKRIKQIQQSQTRSANNNEQMVRTYSKAEAQAWLGVPHPNTLTRLIGAVQQGDEGKVFQREENGHYRFTIEDLHFFADKLEVPRFDRTASQEVQVFTTANLKGGVGKTTSAVNLATGLAVANNKRYRVGFIDLDPQGTGSIFGCPGLSDDDFTVGELLQGKYELDEGENEKEFIRSCFLPTHIPNLHYLPGRVSDFFFESYAEQLQLAAPEDQKLDVYRILHEKIIDAVKDDFDIILIDTAPSLNKAFYNAIYAATSVILPMIPEFISFDATLKYLARFEEIYAIAAKAGHPGLDYIRLLVTNFDSAGASNASTVHRTYVQDLKTLFGVRVFPYAIRHTKAIPICADFMMTVFDMKPSEYPKSRKQLLNAVENLTDVVSEIESLCLQVWLNPAENQA